MIAEEHLAEAQDTGSAAAQVEPDPTWRAALLARLRPADHHISDEGIFALLNDNDEGQTLAERCAASGVTVPMYCVWKSKYRQLDLDELRDARRREQRRRSLTVGAVLVAATLSAGGIVAGISWTLLSSFTGATASAAPAAPAAPVAPATGAPVALAAPAAPATVARVAPASVAPVALAAPDAPAIVAPATVAPATAVTVEESGFRIQVTAADTEEQGRTMVAKLVAAGYPAYMAQASVNNKNVFRVRVGPFETLEDAQKMAADLRSAGYTGAWIAR